MLHLNPPCRPELRATCTTYTSEGACVSAGGCQWDSASTTCAAALSWAKAVCLTQSRNGCENITAQTEDKENGMLVGAGGWWVLGSLDRVRLPRAVSLSRRERICSPAPSAQPPSLLTHTTQACLWAEKSECGSPAPSSSSPAVPAPVPCANRSESFQACVLDSLPEQGCTYWSTGCQPDWSVCYRMVRWRQHAFGCTAEPGNGALLAALQSACLLPHCAPTDASLCVALPITVCRQIVSRMRLPPPTGAPGELTNTRTSGHAGAGGEPGPLA